MFARSYWYTIASGILPAVLWCACNSPLSDVPVSEPSVLRAIALAERDIGASNTTSSVLMLELRDKHEEWVHLKEGSVTVNGLPMGYDGLGAYTRNDAVAPEATYSFVVTLSDGSTYTCVVHTPKNLYQFTVPASHNRTTPLTVGWQETDASAGATLSLQGDSVSAQYYPSSSLGSFTLQPSDLARFHPGETVHLTLRLSKAGQVDGRFMSTSTASASFSIARNMVLQ